MTYHDTILGALESSGQSARRVSIDARGHESAVRSLKRGLDLRGSTIEALCEALGLEFYVGPPRGSMARAQESQIAVPSDVGLPDGEHQFAATTQLPVREWVKGAAVGMRVATRAPAPVGLSDPNAFYVRVKRYDMAADGIWFDRHCLVCPGVPPAVGQRIWLRSRRGTEVLRRLVGVDANEYGLGACRPPEVTGKAPSKFVHRWRRADVAATGVVLAVYLDEPSTEKSQAPLADPVRSGVTLWLQGRTLDDVERWRTGLSAWQRAWGDVAGE